MDALYYVPGTGFPGTIQDAAGNMVAAINTFGEEESRRYGLVFAAAPDMLDAIEATIDALSGSEFVSVVAWLEDVRKKARGQR